MTFDIDTGVIDRHPADLFVPDWFHDLMDPATPPDRILHNYAYHLIGALKNPKKMDTVRRHTLANWAFLQALSERYPTVFDEFMVAYAERVQGGE